MPNGLQDIAPLVKSDEMLKKNWRTTRIFFFRFPKTSTTTTKRRPGDVIEVTLVTLVCYRRTILHHRSGWRTHHLRLDRNSCFKWVGKEPISVKTLISASRLLLLIRLKLLKLKFQVLSWAAIRGQSTDITWSHWCLRRHELQARS